MHTVCQLVFFLVMQIALGKKEYVQRQSKLNFVASVYSAVDWFFDIFFVSEAFSRGYEQYANMGATILLVNIAVNLAVVIFLVAREKKKDNVDKEAWKKSGMFVGIVEFFALNNVHPIQHP